MPSWEEIKRTAQTAFIGQENGIQPMPDTTQDIYRQIRSAGYIYTIGEESLTRQIAEGNLDPQQAQHPEMVRSVEQDKDIEPER